MVTTDEIRDLIAEAEVVYTDCFDTLKVLKTGNFAGFDITRITSFQYKLSRTIFDLSSKYHQIHIERKQAIAEKKTTDEDTFLTYMRSTQGDIKLLEHVISLGKALGDAFAWFFYQGDKQFLGRQFSQQHHLPAPPGVGGMGEVKLLEITKGVLNGNLIIHHGTTTFLTVGDYSLVDLSTFRLAAICELKSDENTLRLNLIFGPEQTNLGLFKSISEQVDETDGPLPPVPPMAPPSGKAETRLRRQVGEIGKTLTPKDVGAEMWVDVDQDQRASKLNDLWSSLSGKTHVFCKVSDGHLLIAVDNSHTALHERLKSNSDWSSIFAQEDMSEQVRTIGLLDDDVPVEDKRIVVDRFHIPTPDTRLRPGFKPLFWWDIDIDLIKAILFHQVYILSICNTGVFNRLLRNAGFQVNKTENGGLYFSKDVNGLNIVFQGYHEFLRLVSSQLLSEQEVVSLISTVVDEAIAQGADENTIIDLSVFHV